MECAMGKAFMYPFFHHTQIWPDQSNYTGQWKDDMMHGTGTLVHADGDVYKGEWTFDMANGTLFYCRP